MPPGWRLRGKNLHMFYDVLGGRESESDRRETLKEHREADLDRSFNVETEILITSDTNDGQLRSSK